jgi:hypothetical protein
VHASDVRLDRAPDVISRANDRLSAPDPSEIAQSILVVDRDRIRRRRLPIG